MNYLPFCGYWFYGAVDSDSRASFTGSWGLLDEAPEYVAPTTFLLNTARWFLEFFWK
jgi:hypothetical protein